MGWELGGGGKEEKKETFIVLSTKIFFKKHIMIPFIQSLGTSKISMVIEYRKDFSLKRVVVLPAKRNVGVFWHAENVLYLVNRSILGGVRHVWPGRVRLVVQKRNKDGYIWVCWRRRG